MTRYDDLVALAIPFSKHFHDHGQACRRLATQLIHGYAAYLSCPLEKVLQVELDRDFKRTEKTSPLTQRCLIRVDGDGFVHFAWSIAFDRGVSRFGAVEFIQLAMRIDDGRAIVREEREFTIDPSDEASWAPFFEHLFEESRRGFSAPYGQRRTRIGFTPLE